MYFYVHKLWDWYWFITSYVLIYIGLWSSSVGVICQVEKWQCVFVVVVVVIWWANVGVIIGFQVLLVCVFDVSPFSYSDCYFCWVMCAVFLDLFETPLRPSCICFLFHIFVRNIIVLIFNQVPTILYITVITLLQYVSA